MKSKTKISLVLALILLMTSSFVIAEELVFKSGQLADLKFYCFNNGTFCSNSAMCNISIFYPNGSAFINNKLMTNQVSFHNLTLPYSYVSGLYRYIVSCADGAVAEGNSGFFRITPTGDTRGVSFTVVIGLAAFFIFLIAIYLKNQYFGFIAGAMMLSLGVYTLIYGFNNVTEFVSNILAYVLLGLGIFLSIASAYELIEEYSEFGG